MKTTFKIFAFGLFIFFSSFTLAQDTPRGLEDLISMKAAYLDKELGMEGYRMSKSSKSGDAIYQNWYNSSKKKMYHSYDF